MGYGAGEGTPLSLRGAAFAAIPGGQVKLTPACDQPAEMTWDKRTTWRETSPEAQTRTSWKEARQRLTLWDGISGAPESEGNNWEQEGVGKELTVLLEQYRQAGRRW